MTSPLESRDAGTPTAAEGAGPTVVRRAPFATNPVVGARGQKTQERILAAALRTFGEVGYHACSIEQITKASGCSRVSFYQYYSSKEDLFRRLAGRVAQELDEATAIRGSITADAAGWDVLRDFLDRYTAFYRTYEPVFLAFPSVAGNDEAVSRGAARVLARTRTNLLDSVQGSGLRRDHVDQVVRILLRSVVPANRMMTLLETTSPTRGKHTVRDVNTAVADVFHRSLFGTDVAVNVHDTVWPFRPSERHATGADADADADDAGLGATAVETRDRIIAAARTVFARRGYYATRVADIVDEAEVSHGLFYRYFTNKTEIFRVLSERAVDRVQATFEAFPSPGQRTPTLRGWLQQFDARYADEAALIAMWIDAMSYDGDLITASLSAIESGRVALARSLRQRDFGAPDADALVLLVLVFAMAEARPAPRRAETFARVIERGLFTPPERGNGILKK